jgi:hypothetical protein
VKPPGRSTDYTPLHDARFRADAPEEEVAADLACPNCGAAPQIMLAMFGMLLVAQCICGSCMEYWLIELRAAQAERLVTDPPAGLAPPSSWGPF